MSKATSRAPSSKSPTPRNTASTSATILSDHPIAARWREVRGEGRAALIPYLTAGGGKRAGGDTTELPSPLKIVCRLLLLKKKKINTATVAPHRVRGRVR